MGPVRPAQISAPVRLSSDHELALFDSGEVILDDWLRRRAIPNEAGGASRTYVVCLGLRVVGYYSLAVGAAAHDPVPGRIRRNMPDPIPVMILGRLAVDKRFQGFGIGKGLLRDAIVRTTQAAAIAGVRAILVHAISDSARKFYLANGFVASPMDPMTVLIPLSEAEDIIRA